MSDAARLIDEPPWIALRRGMPVAERWAYFDHAAVAPLPRAAQVAIALWTEDAARDGTVAWGRWQPQVARLRSCLARLLGADPAEIALVRNTTEGLALVAEGYPWQPGDNVVLPTGEFPSNRLCWTNLASRGVEVRFVPTVDEALDPQEVDAACDARTRIVAASWVGYATGRRRDLRALAAVAHLHGALLCIDGIQGLGAVPLDVREVPVDFLAADGHKWLLGPEGAGVLFVRREHLDRLRPLGIGWNSAKHPGRFEDDAPEIKETAARYEGGTYAMPGLVGLAAGLAWLEATAGFAAVAERIDRVTERLCDVLSDSGLQVASARSPELRSGIVACTSPVPRPQELLAAWRAQGVVANVRAGRLRFSPHAYTNESDLERLADALRATSPPPGSCSFRPA